MIQLLMLMYPKEWREEYGKEYRDLLQETVMSPLSLFDIVKTAFLMRIAVHMSWLITAIGVGQFFLSQSYSRTHGISENLLWMPNDANHAVWLLISITPVIYISYTWLYERRKAHIATR